MNESLDFRSNIYLAGLYRRAKHLMHLALVNQLLTGLCNKVYNFKKLNRSRCSQFHSHGRSHVCHLCGSVYRSGEANICVRVSAFSSTSRRTGAEGGFSCRPANSTETRAARFFAGVTTVPSLLPAALSRSSLLRFYATVSRTQSSEHLWRRCSETPALLRRCSYKPKFRAVCLPVSPSVLSSFFRLL